MKNGIVKSIEERLRSKSPWEIVLILTVISMIKILFGGYSFGLGDLTPQLPRIYRLMDSTYLANDFFINVSEGFGPRYYFLHFFAFLGNYFSLPISFYIIYILSITTIAIVTYRTSKDIYNFSILASILTTSFVLTIDPFELGGGGALVFHYLKPAMLARPFAYIGLWAALKNRPFLAIGLLCISSLLQPLVGLETGLFSLLIISTMNIIQINKDKNITVINLIKSQKKTIFAAAILFLWIYFFWINHYNIQIDNELFIKIWKFRAEDSLIASKFPISGYIGALFFVAAFFVSWMYYFKKSDDRLLPVVSIVTITAILIFCLAGFVFVEIIPTRLGINIWAFRMLFILKWIGTIIIFGAVIDSIINIKDKVTLFISKIRISLKNKLRINISEFAYAILMTISILVFIIVGNFTATGLRGLREIILFVMCVSVIIWFICINKIWLRKLTPVVIIILIHYLLFTKSQLFDFLPNKVLPTINYSSKRTKLHEYEAIKISNYIKENTDKNAIFLTPPLFPEFRLSANRAIIVDLRAIPTNEERHMKEWYVRLIDCYAKNANLEIDLEKEELIKNYKNISDDKLIQIATVYGADYAVLHKETETSFKVKYSDHKFKLVKLKREYRYNKFQEDF